MPSVLPRHTTRRPRAVAGAVLAALLVVGSGAASVVQQGLGQDPSRGPVIAVTGTSIAPTPTVRPSRSPSPAATPAPTAGDPPAAAPPVDPGSEPPAGTDPTADPGAPMTLAPGVLATVRTITPVRAVPSPDGAPGPGLVVRLAVRNDSGAPVDLDGLVVEAAVAGAPAPPSAGGVAAPMAGTLAGGDRASGTYVFRAPTSATAPVLLQVGLAGLPTVGATAP